MRTLRSARQPRHRGAGVPRAGPGRSVRRDARAVPGGRLPGPGEVRLPQRRRRRAGAACAARSHGVLPVPAPDVVRRPGRRGDRRARRRTGRAGGARRHRRDGGQRRLGRRHAARRPGRRRRRRHGRLLRRPAARADPGCRGHAWSTSTRPGRRSRRRLGADFALPADAPGDRDLVVHTSATSAGLQQSLDLLAAEGTVVDLSWYGDAETRLSLGGAFHSRTADDPGQPGRDRAHRDGPAGPRPSASHSPSTCSATRRSTHC